MEAFKTIIWIVNIFSSLAIIGLVLMQHGKGADAGASFGGSGSAQGVFGSSGNANFLTRMTAMSAVIFFASCLALGYINSKATKNSGMDFSTVKQTQVAPVSASMPTLTHNAPAVETPIQAASTVVVNEKASETAVVQSDGSSVNTSAAAVGTAGAMAAGKAVADKVADKSDKKATEKTTDKKATAKDSKKSNSGSSNKKKSDNKKTDKK